MSTLKKKVLELAEIAKECPADLQPICFELLLEHYLDSLQPRNIENVETKSNAMTDEGSATSSNTSANKEVPSLEDVVKSQEDIEEKDLHIKARHFMKKHGISIEKLNNLFYKDNDHIEPLYEDLNTTLMSEGQVRIALLQAFSSAMSNGEFQANTKEIREETKLRKCYNMKNFAAIFKNKKELFDFDVFDKTISSIKLSEEGRKELADIIKDLQ